ncbi:hypothetical protein [Halarchaeum sp. P4]|uniref:hypothetical protein n=1 Tax=Halarchaeum sp. P4 TaxID=3421639 RepID=UPI003EB75268
MRGVPSLAMLLLSVVTICALGTALMADVTQNVQLLLAGETAPVISGPVVVLCVITGVGLVGTVSISTLGLLLAN